VIETITTRQDTMTNLSSLSTQPHITAQTTTHVGQMDSVTSGDGTKISYITFGRGAAVIVIPGVLSTAANYTAFANALAEQFTVHIIERRGRGQSGPQGAYYGMTKECNDVQALRQKTGAAFLVGHSFGGLVALEAARNNKAFTKIAVYEPGVSINGSIATGWMPAYKNALAGHKYLDAFVEFVIGAGPERARTTPRWLMKLILPLMMKPHERQQRLSLLHQNLREHEEVARLDNNYKNYNDIGAEVLLLNGGKDAQPWVTLAMKRLAEVLPQSETKTFPKLDHFGIDQGAPNEVARVVSDYFLSNQKAD
jgi:pimeloyl-ACP methyl ester carboxylesterase